MSLINIKERNIPLITKSDFFINCNNGVPLDIERLYYCIKHNLDIKYFKELIEQGVNLKYTDSNYDLPIIEAIYYKNNEDIIELLKPYYDENEYINYTTVISDSDSDSDSEEEELIKYYIKYSKYICKSSDKNYVNNMGKLIDSIIYNDIILFDSVINHIYTSYLNTPIIWLAIDLNASIDMIIHISNTCDYFIIGNEIITWENKSTIMNLYIYGIWSVSDYICIQYNITKNPKLVEYYNTLNIEYLDEFYKKYAPYSFQSSN